ncbi:MAG TPA: Cof-type HAD-IIB family hydrolase [Clostridia bacterium]
MIYDKFKNKLLITDMDGTLLNSRSSISDGNKKALFHFVKNGGLFTVATGRDLERIRVFTDDLPVGLPAVLYNGAMIYDFKSSKVLWERMLPDIARDVVEKIMSEFPQVGVEVFKGSDIYVLRENQSVSDHMKRDSVTPIYTDLDSIDMPWTKVIFAWEPEKLGLIDRYLKDLAFPVRHFYSQPDFIEILHIEASKGHALKEIVKMSGLNDMHTIAVGDNMNDLDMIKFADTGIAVSNANEDLKAAARLCSVSNNQDAVAQVIKWIEEGVI